MTAKRAPKRSGSARRLRARAAPWSLAIHGGAGDAKGFALDATLERKIRGAMTGVLEAGARALGAGAASLDVVENAVRALEDSPLFNAGKGAVFNSRGEHELDAAIMDGRTLEAGAVASLRGIANPVTLARWVMERSPHVYLQGAGAVAFAQAQGMELVAPDYFWTEASWSALKRARLGGAAAGAKEGPQGTVGAVALDSHGNLAAATSTGGMTNKLPGRVGDSSVIGAGTYASNASCAVSCTGHGEYFIRAAVAHDICARVEYAKEDLRSAARSVIRKKLAALGGDGGVIAIGKRGEFACVFNSELMSRGVVTHVTPAATALFPSERL